MMTRSEIKTKEAIESVKTNNPSSKGDFHYIHLDLSNLITMKSSVDQFLQRKQTLHLLYNNVGVGYAEKDSKT
jgi:NADP-dependent 3-hydroxy acid dehydrogenase YdfG